MVFEHIGDVREMLLLLSLSATRGKLEEGLVRKCRATCFECTLSFSVGAIVSVVLFWSSGRDSFKCHVELSAMEGASGSCMNKCAWHLCGGFVDIFTCVWLKVPLCLLKMRHQS